MLSALLSTVGRQHGGQAHHICVAGDTEKIRAKPRGKQAGTADPLTCSTQARWAQETHTEGPVPIRRSRPPCARQQRDGPSPCPSLAATSSPPGTCHFCLQGSTGHVSARPAQAWSPVLPLPRPLESLSHPLSAVVRSSFLRASRDGTGFLCHPLPLRSRECSFGTRLPSVFRQTDTQTHWLPLHSPSCSLSPFRCLPHVALLGLSSQAHLSQ